MRISRPKTPHLVWGQTARVAVLGAACLLAAVAHAAPVIHWNFNEGEGTILADQETSDGAQDAHYVGGLGVDAVDWVSSGGPDDTGYYDFNQVASGVDLDQVFRHERMIDDPENPGQLINGDILLSNDAPVTNFDLTMSIWFRTTSAGTRSMATFARGNSSSWRLATVGRSGDENPDDRYLQLYARNAGQELTYEAFGPIINDGEWHHAALTTERDETDPDNPTETLRLYLDGELLSVSLLNFLSFEDGVTYPFDLGGSDIPVNGVYNSEIITVGGYGREGSVTQTEKDILEWVGDLDDFQLYQSALDADEIAFLAANPGQIIGGSDGLLGDYNGDLVVDAADYTVWRDSLGQSGSGLAADGDKNGSVGPEDFSIWKMEFGSFVAEEGGGALASNSVPEPSAIALVMLAIGAIANCRWSDLIRRQ